MLTLSHSTAIFCAIATSFPLGQVSLVVLCLHFTVRDKVVPRRIYANFTALNLLYFKILIVNGLLLVLSHGKVQQKRRAL